MLILLTFFVTESKTHQSIVSAGVGLDEGELNDSIGTDRKNLWLPQVAASQVPR